ncbi:MAG: 50S ribosomal protein L17 [bacterium]|nr:50S ribosomal protein L17 [bacterium]
MRHNVSKFHLSRTASHRKALLANMACALIKEKQIHTTISKARVVRPFVERMVTFAKKGDLASRRHVLRHLRQKSMVKLLFDQIGPHFANRPGGYTRIFKMGQRHGDAAPMAILEFLDKEALGGGEKSKEKETLAKKSGEKDTETKKSKVKEPAAKKTKAVRSPKPKAKEAAPKQPRKKAVKKAEDESA